MSHTHRKDPTVENMLSLLKNLRDEGTAPTHAEDARQILLALHRGTIPKSRMSIVESRLEYDFLKISDSFTENYGRQLLVHGVTIDLDGEKPEVEIDIEIDD